MQAIQIISIPVTDQQRAKEFYKLLGFKVLVEMPFENNQQWIQMGLPSDGVSITLVNWFANMPAGSMNGLFIKTDDFEKDIDELKTRGISTGNIEQTPWGKFVSITDPDGNRLSLHQ